MGDSNILVSNGTCYTSAGNKLDGSFIPCGNDAFGHQTCCGAGDNCMADNACFGVHGSGYGSFLTYMGGCTDPEYKDASCPDKHGINQPWIALTLCDNSDGEWAPCSQKGDPTTLQPGSFCSCTDAAKTTVAFKDANSLAQFASLPQSTGQSIAFEAGHTPSGNPTEPASSGPKSTGGSPGSTPTASVAVTTTRVNSKGSTEVATETKPAALFSTTDSAGRGTVVTSVITQTVSSGSPSGESSSNGGSSSGLASGAKIGIGVGAAGAALLLIALLAFICLRRRKRKQMTPSVVEGGGANGTEKKSAQSSLTTPPVPEMAGQPVSEADGRVANPSNVRSELDGTNYFSAVNMNAQRREGPTEQQYVAYRPPPPQEPPAAAELSAVKTPPEMDAR